MSILRNSSLALFLAMLSALCAYLDECQHDNSVYDYVYKWCGNIKRQRRYTVHHWTAGFT